MKTFKTLSIALTIFLYICIIIAENVQSIPIPSSSSTRDIFNNNNPSKIPSMARKAGGGKSSSNKRTTPTAVPADTENLASFSPTADSMTTEIIDQFWEDSVRRSIIDFITLNVKFYKIFVYRMKIMKRQKSKKGNVVHGNIFGMYVEIIVSL
jgi:hypothetical protein